MGILNKEDSSDEAEYLRVKNALFAALAIPYRGDTTRYIRDIGKNILRADNREEFLEEYEDIVEDVYETFQEKEIVTKEIIRQVNTDLESKKKSESIIEDKIAKTIITNIQGKPIESLKRAITALESIDMELNISFRCRL
ncbi:ParB/Sulfiredoxin domain-containing protein OS=Lysinibacillus sphaericus OX=1421 GN=LS41612_04835 PE=4 SV=1 [Lysinibacillus sphaericus]